MISSFFMLPKTFLLIFTSLFLGSWTIGEPYRLVGIGKFPPIYNGGETTEFSIEVKYDMHQNESSRPPEPQSSIAAIRTIGEITLNFGAINQTYPFYVTQFSDGSNSLVGYYITNGYPHVLKFDAWSKEKRFYLYESFRHPALVLQGKAALIQP